MKRAEANAKIMGREYKPDPAQPYTNPLGDIHKHPPIIEPEKVVKKAVKKAVKKKAAKKKAK